MVLRLALLLTLLLPLGPAFGQGEQKPVRIIVPFAPGASADGIARAIAIDLGRRMSRTVVVENMAGAGGTAGLLALAKSPPDGDTLGVGATGAMLINPNLPKSTAPDLLKVLTPVAKLIEVGVVVIAHPKSGPKNVLEMIARSKENPTGLSYGSAGVHTGQHLSMEILKQLTGANLVHIPYRGSAPAIVDLVSGQIPLDAGQMRALGIAGPKRAASLPDVPTIAESGVPGFGRAGGFIGLFAPAGTPPAVVKKISAEVGDILKTPAIEKAVKALTVSVSYQDEATFLKFLTAESARWKTVLQSLKLE
jgi:tripartite-type tricarboxylate transporter receptor subunit TctC